MKSRIVLMMSLSVVLVWPVFGFAADKEAAPPCQNEIKKMCKKAQGEEAVNKCLRDNVANITVACKTHLDNIAEYKQITAQVTNLRTTCKIDLESLCSAVQPGEGRQLRCLRSHSEKLTSGCRELMVQSGVMDLKPEPVPAPAAPMAAPAAPMAAPAAPAAAPAAPAAAEAAPAAAEAAPAAAPASAPEAAAPTGEEPAKP